MNQQIKEIVDRVGLYLPTDNQDVLDKELEFFAETIVNECAVVCEKLGIGGDFFSLKIKEHFGINKGSNNDIA